MTSDFEAGKEAFSQGSAFNPHASEMWRKGWREAEIEYYSR